MIPTEPYNVDGQGTADATGSCTILFPAPPQLAQLVGMVAVTTPNVGTWQAYIDDQKVGQPIVATNGGGNFTIQPGKRLSLKGTGVVSGNQYSATFTGLQTDPKNPLTLPTPMAPSTVIQNPVVVDELDIFNQHFQTTGPQTHVLANAAENQYAGVMVNIAAGISVSVAGAIENVTKGIISQYQTVSFPGTGANAGRTIFFPIPCDIGDVLEFIALGVTGNTLLVVTVWGLGTMPPNTPILRPDGRLPPVGALTSALVLANNGNVNMLPAVAGVSYMLKSATVLSEGTTATIVIGSITGTINGQGAAFVLCGSGGEGNLEWENGLLCDANTPVVMGSSGAANVLGSVQYDPVA